MALADKDVDATMASDWATIQDKYRADEPEVEAIVADEPTSEGIADAPVLDRAREPDGKFKAEPKETKADKVEKTTPVAAKDTLAAPSKEGAAAATPEPTDAPQRDITRAPSTWKPTARAEYDKLPPAIKAEIHRREADFQNGQAQLLPDAKMGAELRQVIEPYRMLIETEGGTPARAVGDLLRTAAILRTGSVQQKYGAIAQVANLYGIDLRAFGAAPAGAQPVAAPQPQQFRDPRVDQMLAHQQQQDQQRASQEAANTENTVTRWMNEVDTQGKPKREYLGDVINEMSALVPQLRQADPSMTHAQALDAAYDRAIWAHPEIRALLTQKQQTDLEAQRRADNQTRVRDAKRAGSVNVPRRASIPSPGKPGTMNQTIEQTARELGLIT